MDELKYPFDAVYLYLTALAISIPRTLGLFFVLPIMTRLGLPRFLQLAFAIVICIPLATPLAAQIRPLEPLSPVFAAMICLKEAFIGLLLGLIMGLPFWAMEVAGNIVDFVRQAPDAAVQDPQGTTETSITGNLFSIFATLYFISAGGITIMIDVIYKSYEIWPALHELPGFNEKGAAGLLELLDSLLRASLLIAGPLLIFILIAFLMLTIIARFASQINVFDLSMSFRNIAFLIAIQVYSIYIISYFILQSSYINKTIDVVKGFFE